MKNKSLHHKHLMLVAIMLASIGLVIANGPAVAQQTPEKWNPAMETITVTASPVKDLRGIWTGGSFGDVFITVSASIPVPYSDLDLAKEPGAAELGRRINVAARLICLQLNIKYPPTEYPAVAGDDCEQSAAKDGLSKANLIIAAAKR